MPAQSLRCRVCEREHELEAVGVCAACFGPLDPVYDWDVVRETFTREAIASGPASIWRYAPLLPVAAPAEPRLAPGLTPLLAAPRLASALGLGELYLKLDTANPTHSIKDRVVAVACAKAYPPSPAPTDATPRWARCSRCSTRSSTSCPNS